MNIYIIFHIKTVVFQILRAIFGFFIEVFLKFSQPTGNFQKSASQMKIDEEHLF